MSERNRDRIGDFEVTSRLGGGAQGETYKVVCVSQENRYVARNEIVALKEFKVPLDGDAARAAFTARAESLRGLRHRNIAGCRDFCFRARDRSTTGCVITELASGESLAARIRKSPGGFPWDVVRGLFADCLDALAHAAENGFTLPRISSANLIVSADGAVKVTGFEDTCVQRGENAGTGGGDQIAMIRALGGIFYEALTGKGLSFEEDAKGSAGVRNVFAHGVFRVLGSECRDFVVRCFRDGDHGRKFATLREMRQALDSIKPRVIKGTNSYELLSYLGRGGFGEVYKGRNIADGSEVAIKYLYADQQAERFLREARVLQKAANSFVVKYIDFAETTGLSGEPNYFLIMEFLDGMPGWTLKNRIREAPGGLDVVEALTLFINYLDALQHLHDSGIIHRDIKPSNLYAPAGHPENAKIFDLGIARDVSGTVTRGHIPGTLDYMAPEFAVSSVDRGSARSDIYSTGLSFYEALAGKPCYPRFPKNERQALLAFIELASGKTQAVIDFSRSPFTRYPELADAVKRSVDRNPAHRYRSAAEMKEALERILRRVRVSGVPAPASGPEPEATPVPAKPARVEPAKKPAEPARAEAGNAPSPAPAPAARVPHVAVAPPGRALPPEPGPLPRVAPAPREATAADDIAEAGAGGGRDAGRYFLRALAIVTMFLALLACMLLAMREVPKRRARDHMRTVCSTLDTPRPEAAYVSELEGYFDEARKGELNDAKYAARWSVWQQILKDRAVAVPRTFRTAFDKAVRGKDRAVIRVLAREWDALRGSVEFMGIAEPDYTSLANLMKNSLGDMDTGDRITRLENSVPVQISPENIARAEECAREYAALLDAVEALPDKAFRDRLRGVSARLSEAAADYVRRQEQTALMWCQKGKKDNARQKFWELDEFGEKAPFLVNMIKPDYERALSNVRENTR